MAAATHNLKFRAKGPTTKRIVKVAATTTIYQHTLVCLNGTGFAVPASDTAGLSSARGLALAFADNSAGADGDLCLEVAEGVFLLNNSGGDPLTQANQFLFAYVEDDNTVAVAAGPANDIIAGTVEEFSDASGEGPWIRVGSAGLSE